LNSDLRFKGNDDLRVEQSTQALLGIQVGFCVGGGIAATESIRVIRELRRMGAHVQVYATEAALRFVGRDSLEWASSQAVVSQASGLAEHIAQENLVVVFPATCDLIAKMAHGHCPDACSTYLQSALGQSLPVMVVPTMHDSLRNSPAFIKNLDLLRSYPGIQLIPPRVEEGKWKSPLPDELVLELTHRYNKSKKQTADGPKTALVTLGGTISKLDAARAISNMSTGFLGTHVIRSLLENGIEVTALCGQISTTLSDCTGLEKFDCINFAEMQAQLQLRCQQKKFDGFFHLAAVSDFGTEADTNVKISSSSDQLTVTLKKLPKLISLPCLTSIPFRIACKFTASNSSAEQEKATELLIKNDLQAVYWNWGESAFGMSNDHTGLLLTNSGKKLAVTDKKDFARFISTLFMNPNLEI